MPHHICMGAHDASAPWAWRRARWCRTPKTVMTSHMVAANIMDHIPMVNILPFGMCNSPANPTVAAATAAALGRADADALHPATPGAVGPGRADGAARQRAGAGQQLQADVHVGRRDQGQRSPGQATEQIP